MTLDRHRTNTWSCRPGGRSCFARASSFVPRDQRRCHHNNQKAWPPRSSAGRRGGPAARWRSDDRSRRRQPCAGSRIQIGPSFDQPACGLPGKHERIEKEGLSRLAPMILVKSLVEPAVDGHNIRRVTLLDPEGYPVCHLLTVLERSCVALLTSKPQTGGRMALLRRERSPRLSACLPCSHSLACGTVVSARRHSTKQSPKPDKTLTCIAFCNSLMAGLPRPFLLDSIQTPNS